MSDYVKIIYRWSNKYGSGTGDQIVRADEVRAHIARLQGFGYSIIRTIRCESWQDSIQAALNDAERTGKLAASDALSATQVYEVTRQWRERVGLTRQNQTRRAFHKAIWNMRKTGLCARVSVAVTTGFCSER